MDLQKAAQYQNGVYVRVSNDGDVFKGILASIQDCRFKRISSICNKSYSRTTIFRSVRNSRMYKFIRSF